MELKTVIVGETDVGKTSLSARFCHGALPPMSTPTIGASFLQKRVDIEVDGEAPTEVVFQLWDTAGQERFRSMAPMYYRGAKAAVIVFDVTKENPFDKVEYFRNEILQYGDPSVVVSVAANKVDLVHPDFDLATIEETCAQLKCAFHVTSAFSGEGVDELFFGVARRAVKAKRDLDVQFPTNQQNNRRNRDSPVALKPKDTKKGSPCC